MVVYKRYYGFHGHIQLTTAITANKLYHNCTIKETNILTVTMEIIKVMPDSINTFMEDIEYPCSMKSHIAIIFSYLPSVFIFIAYILPVPIYHLHCDDAH